MSVSSEKIDQDSSGAPERAFTCDELVSLHTGLAASLETFCSLLRGRRLLEYRQSIMEAHFRWFGVELTKTSNVVRIDAVTRKITSTAIPMHTKLNPTWQAAKGRERRREFLHFMAQKGIRLNQLHYFVLPACTHRLPVGADLRASFEEAKSRLKRLCAELRRVYGKCVDPQLSALEWTVNEEGLYLHINFIVWVEDWQSLPIRSAQVEHDRRSAIWSCSGVKYAHRPLGFGQLLDMMQRHWVEKGRTIPIFYNGTVRDAGALLTYINKTFDPTDIEDRPDITQWIYDSSRGLNLYAPLGLFRKWRGELQKNRQVVFDLRGKTFVREKRDSDLHRSEEPKQVDERKKDGADDSQVENWIVGRIRPIHWTRYMTPSLLVMNYNPDAKGTKSRQRLADIEIAIAEAQAAFQRNAPNVDYREIEAEAEFIEQVFIIDPMVDETSLSPEARQQVFDYLWSVHRQRSSSREPDKPHEAPRTPPEPPQSEEGTSRDVPDFLSIFDGEYRLAA